MIHLLSLPPDERPGCKRDLLWSEPPGRRFPCKHGITDRLVVDHWCKMAATFAAHPAFFDEISEHDPIGAMDINEKRFSRN